MFIISLRKYSLTYLQWFLHQNACTDKSCNNKFLLCIFNYFMKSTVNKNSKCNKTFSSTAHNPFCYQKHQIIQHTKPDANKVSDLFLNLRNNFFFSLSLFLVSFYSQFFVFCSIIFQPHHLYYPI